jgi:pimeloyl-ACP methyl ester carboxylesterase
VHSVEALGLRVAYERRGEGPPVVLLHGGLSDHREWRLQHVLADEFTLIAWDAPGCGESDDPPESFRMPDYADTLADFLRAANVGSPCVVGLSFGSSLALELACRHPSVPRALVLVGAYAGWAGSLPAVEVARRLDTLLPALDGPREDLAASFVETLLTGGASDEVTALVTAMTAEYRAGPMRTMLYAMAECDLRACLPRISVPTLLVHGELDARSPLRAAQEIAAAIPGATLTVLADAGHQANFEAAEAFTAELRAFLRSLDT